MPDSVQTRLMVYIFASLADEAEIARHDIARPDKLTTQERQGCSCRGRRWCRRRCRRWYGSSSMLRIADVSL